MRFKLTDFILGLLGWLVITAVAWVLILFIQAPLVNNTSSADEKHFIDFWLNLLPWPIFLIVSGFLLVRKRWAALTGWVSVAILNFIALIIILPSLPNLATTPDGQTAPYLLYNIPFILLLAPPLINFFYLWLL